MSGKFYMNKNDLINVIASNTGNTKKDVGIILDAFQEAIKEAVSDGEKVTLGRFAIFEKKHIDEKSGTSYIGGVAKPWNTPAKDIVSVKLSKVYREL